MDSYFEVVYSYSLFTRIRQRDYSTYVLPAYVSRLENEANQNIFSETALTLRNFKLQQHLAVCMFGTN